MISNERVRGNESIGTLQQVKRNVKQARSNDQQGKRNKQ